MLTDMATTNEILDSARELGKKIATHAVAVKLEGTIGRLQEDREAQRLLADYQRHLTALGEKEAAGKPIEVEDKAKLEKLQNGVVRNPVLREFQMAQMDYVDLMRQVDEAISGVTPESEAAAASPLVNPDLTV